jgi:hypothetical protein
MRAIFSLLSLVVVLGVLGLLAKKQLTSLHSPDPAATGNVGIALPATTPDAPPAERSQQIQTQIKSALDAALQQARPVPDDK